LGQNGLKQIKGLNVAFFSAHSDWNEG